MFTEQPPAHGPALQGYGPGGFRLGETWHAGPVLVTPAGVLPWPEAAVPVTEAALAPVRLLDPLPEILVLGTGDALVPLAGPLRVALCQAGVAVEVMATPAACRTLAVLLSEGRPAAAALVPVS